MSGIFGFTGKNCGAVQENMQALEVWNRSYGRETGGMMFMECAGIGCHLEHLSQNVPIGHPVWKTAGGKAVVDALLYNREELAELLHIQCLSEMSDEELLLRLIEEKGLSALRMVNGDFAGAMYDEKEREWHLFRDHLGVRPLFYYLDGEQFIFSTDMRGIAAVPGVDLRVNEEQFYLHAMGYVTLSLRDTAFKKIQCVPPASWMTVRKCDGTFSVEEQEYWKLKERKIVLETDEAYRAELRRLIVDSVRRRLDAVTGMAGGELSGGLDSSVIAILIKRLGREAKYYSWSFSPDDLPLVENDERSIILDICRQEGISCHFPNLPKEQKTISTEEILKIMNPPYVNTLQIGQGAKWLSEQGVKAVFTGHGGDEGVSHRCNPYELWYHGEYAAFIRNSYRRRKRRSFPLMRTAVDVFRQMWAGGEHQKPFRSTYHGGACLHPSFIDRMEKSAVKQPLYFAYDPAVYVMQGGSRSRMDNVALQGAENGVRYLLPFLDHRVIDFALSIPRAQYYDGVENRLIYLKAFEDLLPTSLRRFHSKSTLSTQNIQSRSEEYRTRFETRKKKLLPALDRNFWSEYLDLTRLDELVLDADCSEEEYLNADSALDLIQYCLFVQKIGKCSMEWVKEHSDSTAYCTLLEE